jgi:3-dehydroquinate synthase
MRCKRGSEFSVFRTPGLLAAGEVPTWFNSMLGGRTTLVVTTPTVHRLYGTQLVSALQHVGARVDVLVLECRETEKTLEQVERVCSRACDLGLRRDDIVVALGGGVCSDIVTVAASLIRRSVSHVRVPTTLVGQVDAGVGIKGAVNFGHKKSFLGVFHPPTAVAIDSVALATLPAPAIRDGIAEILKIALVHDASLFAGLEAFAPQLVAQRFQSETGDELIEQAIVAMLEELETNAYEHQTYRRLVDLGHTFGPRLEEAQGFGVTHGTTVAVDIALSTAIGVELGLLRPNDQRRILDVIRACGLPVWSQALTLALCHRAIVDAERHRGGALNLIVPCGIGSACVVPDAGSVAGVLHHALRRARAATVERMELATA